MKQANQDVSETKTNPSNETDESKQKVKENPPQTSATTPDIPNFGWSTYAERVNGRFAMIGFSAVLIIEILSSDTFLHWSGLIP